MTMLLAAALYFILWWLVLFIVLPIGVKTQQDEGRVEPGTVASAPIAPQILIKLVATTLVSGLLFGIGYTAWQTGHVSLESIPFLPEFPSLADPG